MRVLTHIKGVAILFAALFVFFTSENLFAGKGETYRDLIKKAQNLLLQQDRLQALQIMSDGVRKEPAKSLGRKELIKASAKFGSLFLTDDGQKIFELARSLKAADPTQAIEKLQDALKKEPGNLLVSLELVRAHLRANDCGKGKKAFEIFKDLYPSQPSIQLLNRQISFCLNESIVELEEDLTVFDKNSKELSVYQAQVLASKVKTTSLEVENKDINLQIKKLIALDPSYPEAYYLSFKLEQKLGLDMIESAKKYGSLCKQRPNPDFYIELDPWLCTKSEEISSYLLKIGIEQ